MKRAVRWIVILLIIAGVGYSYSATVRMGLYSLTGRSPECTFGRALEVPGELEQQIGLKERLLSESRKMEDNLNGYSRWHTPEGDFWIPATSAATLHFDLAEQARKIYGSGEQAVKLGDVVFDCGANIGLFTSIALRAGARRIIAVEPSPENLECYRRNFSGAIDEGKIVLIPKGVWDKEDTLTLYVDPNDSKTASFMLKPKGAEGKIQVALTTIDKIVADIGLEKVDFIKLDIEGSESNALRGAARTIKRFKPRISVAAYHNAEDPRRIAEAISATRTDYKRECGPCLEMNNGVRPMVLWFR